MLVDNVVFLECWVVWIVCTGGEKIVQLLRSANMEAEVDL